MVSRSVQNIGVSKDGLTVGILEGILPMVKVTELSYMHLVVVVDNEVRLSFGTLAKHRNQTNADLLESIIVRGFIELAGDCPERKNANGMER